MVNRFEVYLINLDTEISKNPRNTRPGVIVSPDEMNRNLSTVIIAPISSAGGSYPTRVPVDFLNSQRVIALDQLRTVDQQRLVKKIGEVDKEAQKGTLALLKEMFEQ